MLHTGFNYRKESTIVRYLKESSNELIQCSNLYYLPISQGIIHKKGKNIAILNFGTFLEQMKKVASDLNATLVDMRFIKPLDKNLLNKIASSHKTIITIEDNSIIGGAGSGVNELIMKNKNLILVLNIGLPDSFIIHRSRQEILLNLGLDSTSVRQKFNPGFIINL